MNSTYKNILYYLGKITTSKDLRTDLQFSSCVLITYTFFAEALIPPFAGFKDTSPIVLRYNKLYRNLPFDQIDRIPIVFLQSEVTRGPSHNQKYNKLYRNLPFD